MKILIGIEDSIFYKAARFVAQRHWRSRSRRAEGLSNTDCLATVDDALAHVGAALTRGWPSRWRSASSSVWKRNL
jgi:hypothetical protein